MMARRIVWKTARLQTLYEMEANSSTLYHYLPKQNWSISRFKTTTSRFPLKTEDLFFWPEFETLLPLVTLSSHRS